MILSFSAKNFRSIKNEAVLSFIADTETIEHDTSLSKTDKFKILPVAGIYGANASGKTSILQALNFFFVLTQKSFGFAGDSFLLRSLYAPYLFDTNTLKSPTEFELNFMLDNVRYQYGFSFTHERIISEWLYDYSTSDIKTIFTRDWREDNYNYTNVKGTLEEQINLPNQHALLLSVLMSTAHETGRVLAKFFFSKLYSIEPTDQSLINSQNITKKLIDDSSISKNEVLEFLQCADFNIHNFDIEQIAVNKSQFPPILHGVLGENPQQLKITTYHKNENSIYSLDFNQESRGTQATFNHSGVIIDILKKGGILLFDEINSSLHPLLVRYIINLFMNKEINIHGAQLLFTTHDTSLLDSKILRKDQIWFCDKDSKNISTKLYSLLDFKKNDFSNMEFAYLYGKFAAIPNVKDFFHLSDEVTNG